MLNKKQDSCFYIFNNFIEKSELSSKALVLLIKLISISKFGLSTDNDNFISKKEALRLFVDLHFIIS